MRPILLDLSQRSELRLHARVAADVIEALEYSQWTTDDDFDFERSGARMLGRDMRKLLHDDGLTKVAGVLQTQLRLEVADLPQHMDRHAPELARQLLLAMYEALQDPLGWRSARRNWQ